MDISRKDNTKTNRKLTINLLCEGQLLVNGSKLYTSSYFCLLSKELLFSAITFCRGTLKSTQILLKPNSTTCGYAPIK